MNEEIEKKKKKRKITKRRKKERYTIGGTSNVSILASRAI